VKQPDSGDQMRRAVAFLKAMLDGDSLAHDALGPDTPKVMEHLWEADPLRAALWEPLAKGDRDLVTSLCVLVISVARQPAMDQDQLLAFLGQVLDIGPADRS